jgi:hypothetical protein
MERIVAITGRTQTLAIIRAAVARAGVRTIVVDGRPLVVWHRAGQASALDDARVARGRDIGTVAVLVPAVDGRLLTFARSGGGFVDAQTHTTWNVLGRATRGSPAGRQLAAYPFVDTFWFTCVAFRPDTKLIR